MRSPGRSHNFHALIAPDAMIDMHHQIAGTKRLGFGQEILGPALFLRLADQTIAQHVLF